MLGALFGKSRPLFAVFKETGGLVWKTKAHKKFQPGQRVNDKKRLKIRNHVEEVLRQSAKLEKALAAEAAAAAK